MDRIIKFLIWDKSKKCFIHDSQSFTIQEIYHSKSAFEMLEDVEERYDFIRFIGLTDIDGQEIYEGHIVKWDNGSDGMYVLIAVVEYAPNIRFRIVGTIGTKHPRTGTRFEYGSFAYRDTENHLKIIGNKYENPDLMEHGIKGWDIINSND